MKAARIYLFFSILFSILIFTANAEAKLIEGLWGGEGITLFATPSGADGDFYCSWGRVTEPIITDDDGNFSAVGIVEYWTGSPQPAQATPAIFSGVIDGKQMQLRIALQGHPQVWNFVLRKGNKGTDYKCR